MALFGDSISFDLGVITAILCVAAYVYIVRSRNKWMRMGIPVSEPSLLFGNMTDVILRKKNLHETVKDFYLKNKDRPYVSFFAFTQPIVMINDMELVRQVLIKDFHMFTDRHFVASSNEPLAFWSMFMTKGDFWKNLRHKLSPTFTSGKIKRMFELIDACGKEFVPHLEREMDQNGDILIREATARYTSDIITSAAFGIEGDAMKKEDSAFRKFTRKATEPTALEGLKNFLIFLCPLVAEKFDLQIFNREVAEFARKTVWNTVEYREKNKVKRNDFLDLMLQLRRKGYIEEDASDTPKENVNVTDGVSHKEKIDFDGDVFVAQCLMFMNAGFDSSSITMTWALYELALHPDLQQRAYVEIVRVLSNEAMQEMEYLQRVVHETLRKYPFLSLLDRQTTQPFTIPGTDITLKKGQGVAVPVMGIHYDPDIYPEPDRFDPDRFTPENIQSRPSCSFLGFGDGPRMCLGMRMGLLQTKVGLAYFMKNFVVKTCERTPIPVVYDKSNIIPSSEVPIVLRLEKRTQ